jgi:hypothetical protein
MRNVEKHPIVKITQELQKKERDEERREKEEKSG